MKLQGIAKHARSSEGFRKALHTGRRIQVVVMSLKKGEGTKEEAHPHSDQFLYVLHGDGEAMIGGRMLDLDRGDGLFVETGTRLRLRNTGKEELRVLSVLSPPVFPSGWVQESGAVSTTRDGTGLEAIEAIGEIDESERTEEEAPRPGEANG